jgi:type III pantothenate kinase
MEKLGIAEVTEARSLLEAGGVTNGYEIPERLGQDRWLALLGARRLTGKACLVIDLGTAVTADLLTESGLHLGGYICPGMSLLRGQLQKHTRRIRYRADEAVNALDETDPGRNTMEAVERGCRAMLRGFVLSQLELAGSHLGADYDVLLTGGDAGLIGPLPVPARIVPDLVFLGLGIACPIEGT